VTDGLLYLKNVQDSEGCFGSRVAHNFTYSHIIATHAFVEAYRRTRFPLFKRTAQKALDFLEHARNPERGWRYGVQPGESDSCVTSWAVLPLDSGRASGLDVSTEAFTDARRYLDEVTDESGRVGYNRKGTLSVRVEEVLDTFPPQETEALTAMAVVARLLAGSSRRPDDARIERGFGLLLAKPPSGRPSSMDLIYWYFGARAMEMMDDPRRESWDEALREVILKTQIAAGENRSSWNPDDAWGKEGGRVYTTALMALCLETLPR
jgi:hypothetical protein